jgi:hypothetical protein
MAGKASRSIGGTVGRLFSRRRLAAGAIDLKFLSAFAAIAPVPPQIQNRTGIMDLLVVLGFRVHQALAAM